MIPGWALVVALVVVVVAAVALTLVGVEFGALLGCTESPPATRAPGDAPVPSSLPRAGP